MRFIRGIRNSFEKKYSNLLTVLLINFIFVAFIQGLISRILFSLLFSLAMISIVETFTIKSSLFKLYSSIVIFAFLLELMSNLALMDFSNIAHLILVQFIHIAYLAVAIYLIFKDIISSKQVTLDTILGSICIYFLIGFLWAVIYSVCITFDHNAFSQSISELKSFRTFIYFSFTTLTTVGYGDISPVSSLARMLSNLQAIVGQMYPAVIISILVSIYTSDRGK